MTYIPTFKKESIKLMLPFSEGTGTTAYDYSGEGNNGTISGATYVKVVDGGYALDFDGTNDYVNIGETPFDYTTAVSVSAWVNTGSLTDLSQYTVFTSAENYRMAVYGDAGTTNRLRAWIHDGTAYRVAIEGDGAGSVTEGNWHHIVMTYNKVAIKLYVDGSEVASTATTNNIRTNAGNAAIGSAPGLTLEFFDGLIRQPLIFNVALSADEVTTLYKQTYIQ